MSEEQKVVKVRIAVAVDPLGNWNSCGYNSSHSSSPLLRVGEGFAYQPAVYTDEKYLMGIAVDPLEEGEARFWIEALLPIPQPIVIQGIVISDTAPNNSEVACGACGLIGHLASECFNQ